MLQLEDEVDDSESSVWLPMEDPNLEIQLVVELRVVGVALVHQSLEVLHQTRRLMALVVQWKAEPS